MNQTEVSKEALFNEVKGSLFEYLVARELAHFQNAELKFIESIDKNYLNVLSQQDRLMRQFYPEMIPFLSDVSKLTARKIAALYPEVTYVPWLCGKFSKTAHHFDINEADIVLDFSDHKVPISLKLNKKNAYVNTKSGGIKSFFNQYFSFLSQDIQFSFNQFIDLEFERMAREIHAFHGMEFRGNFNEWVKNNHSELPGELSKDERDILKRYYARIANKMHRILKLAQDQHSESFINSLPTLMGFGTSEIVQFICFHDFKGTDRPVVAAHTYQELLRVLSKVQILDFNDTASVELRLGDWSLQIRVKPMNKFTTTAIKVNCSVKIMRPIDV